MGGFVAGVEIIVIIIICFVLEPYSLHQHVIIKMVVKNIIVNLVRPN